MVRLAPFARFAWPLRWLFRILTLLVILALLLAGTVTWTVRRSFPQTSGELTLPGLTKPVTVYRDAYGVPQIYADTPDDLFRAQGYVHAQDRFWEMDFRRKTTAGRLSELFGEATLDIDKVVRTLGWRRVAEREFALLDPEAQRGLEAYAAGVNAWLDQNDGFADRSLEYAVLKLTNGAYRPEPWTPADSLAWMKAMAWDLRSNMDDELERALDAGALPVARVDELFPAYPYDRHRPIVTAGAVQDTKFDPAAPVTAASAALTRVSRVLRTVPSLLGTDGADRKGIGSNSWVVAGKFTDTGKPLLANDPHLGPRIPSIWYQAGLHCRTRSAACPYDVAGFTFSGLPGVVIGHNHRVAWGFTNLGPDVTDLYVERIQGETYQTETGWVPFQTLTEQIKVAGGAPVELKVRSTRHGPIISEVLESAGKSLPGAGKNLGEGAPADSQAIALRWTALEPSITANAIFLLNTAENWDQFRKAASYFEAPSQNLIYADVDGNIGYQAPGKIPIRSSGDGRWPSAGWTGEQEWTGYIPFEELPYAYNPPEGWIATANNAAIGPGYRHFLTSDWAYGYRSQRIADRLKALTAAGKVTLQSMADLQMDDTNGLAPTLVPHLLRVGGGHTALLKDWNHTQSRDSAPAAYFNVIWRNLLARVFHDELPEGARPQGGDRWWEIMRAVLDDPDAAWWDDVRTKNGVETRDDMLRAAIADADAEIAERLGDDPADWRWGDLHTLELTHETFGTSGIAPIEWLFNRGPLPAAGSKDAVNATGWSTEDGYEVDWVPSMRMVVDLADLDRSRWINLTGASGHAFHSSYADQAELWADGATTPWPFTKRATETAAADTLTLKP
ncbi:penicillin acylase family protein [Acrocarpospora catenulata]|uniref:penicillin acylase family protein n=1 Tax=Acrocarpospora catenulata TaxID=2836182 RepID=UPI001BDA1C65|nr:penicillin acylase family protein [Acrocarpospora catenulata]